MPKRARKDDRRPRSDQYKDGHPYSFLPIISPFEWLAEVFRECGMCGHGMNGPIALSWQEIHAYNKAVGPLGKWALATIKAMSDAYVGWYHKGGEQGDIATDVPYIERTEETIQAARKSIKPIGVQ